MSKAKNKAKFIDGNCRAKFFCFLNPGYKYVEGTKADIIKDSNIKVEYKTDNHVTGNLFLEWKTILPNGVELPGGVYKADNDGCETIIFDFNEPDGPINGLYHYNVKKLKSFQTKNWRKYRLVTVKTNFPWTVGLVVPYLDIEHLIERKQPSLEAQWLEVYGKLPIVTQLEIYRDIEERKLNHNQIYEYLAAYFHENQHIHFK